MIEKKRLKPPLPPNKFVLEFTVEEFRLLKYWQASCHENNPACPLHCVDEGLEFCHKFVEKIAEDYKKWKEEN